MPDPGQGGSLYWQDAPLILPNLGEACVCQCKELAGTEEAERP
jgi:hypothetical protein